MRPILIHLRRKGRKMKLKTKQVVLTGIFLGICIASQFLKNTSVYVTGSIINLVLLLTTGYCGVVCGIIISIITPVTSFIITGSPLISMVPAIMPAIMAGNIIYVLAFYFIKRIAYDRYKGAKTELRRMAATLGGGAVGAVLKAGFMGVVIVKIILPLLGHNVPEKLMTVAKVQFSLVQLITAGIGCALATIIFWRIGANPEKQAE